MKPLFLVINLNPAWQKVYLFPRLVLNRVNRVAKISEFAAGKGVNAGRSLQCLQEKVILLGYLGTSLKKKFKEHLKSERIKNEFTNTARGLRTCLTLLNKKTGEITEITEPGALVSLKEKKEFRKVFTKYVSQAEAVILSGTIPPGEDTDIYYQLIKQAQKHKTICILDSYGKYAQKALLASPDIFKINRQELEEFTQRKLSNLQSVKSALAKLKKKYNIKTIIITDGPKNTIVMADQAFYLAYPPQIKAVNPVGSGDAFTGGYISAYLKTRDIKTSLLTATACGTANALNIEPGKFLISEVNQLKTKIRIKSLPVI